MDYEKLSCLLEIPSFEKAPVFLIGVRFREAGLVRNFERLPFNLPWEGTAFNYDKLLR